MPNNSTPLRRELQVQANEKELKAHRFSLISQHYLDAIQGEPNPHIPTPPRFEFYAIFYHTNPILDKMLRNKLNLQFAVRQMLIQEYNNSLKNNAL